MWVLGDDGRIVVSCNTHSKTGLNGQIIQLELYFEVRPYGYKLGLLKLR